MGQPRKYPIGNLLPLESVVLPWLEDDHGRKRKCQKALTSCVYQEMKRYGKRFNMLGTPAGLKVTRLPERQTGE